MRWVVDGIDDAERQAVQWLVDIEISLSMDSAPALVNKPWVADGLDQHELEVVETLVGLAQNAKEAAAQIISMPFLATVDDTDVDAMVTLAAMAERQRGLFDGIVSKPWFQDGVNGIEAKLLQQLGILRKRSKAASLRIATRADSPRPGSFFEDSLAARYDFDNNGAIEHAEVIFASADYFVAYLASDELLHIIAHYAFSESLIPTPTATEVITASGWYRDGLTEGEGLIAGLMRPTEEEAPDFAAKLASAPWVTDGITDFEIGSAIRPILEVCCASPARTPNPQIAKLILDQIPYPPESFDIKLVGTLSQMSYEYSVYGSETLTESFRVPERLSFLLSEPWFADGLDQRERVYLVAGSGSEHPFESSTIETKTIELPLAGTVKLWVLGHHEFNVVDTLSTMERAVRGSEEFWQIPFPLNHVILYVTDPGSRGRHVGFATYLDEYDGVVPQWTIFQAVAYNYFSQGPHWFKGGGANVVAHHISNNGNLPDPVFPEYCSEQGLQSLQDWIELDDGSVRSFCTKGMGEHFLLTLHQIMGTESWLAALRAFFLEFHTEGALMGVNVSWTYQPDDRDVYRVFLEHAPPHLAEDVQDVFRRLHGGPFTDQKG